MIAIRKITVIAGLLIIAGLVSRAGAAGTTITVTSLNDSAQGCTLSDALIVANKGGGSSNGCSAWGRHGIHHSV